MFVRKIHLTNKPPTILNSIKEPNLHRKLICLIPRPLRTFPTSHRKLLILPLIRKTLLIILNDIHKILHVILCAFNIYWAFAVFWGSELLGLVFFHLEVVELLEEFYVDLERVAEF